MPSRALFNCIEYAYSIWPYVLRLRPIAGNPLRVDDRVYKPIVVLFPFFKYAIDVTMTQNQTGSPKQQ